MGDREFNCTAAGVRGRGNERRGSARALLRLLVQTLGGTNRSQIALVQSMVWCACQELSQQGFGAGMVGRAESRN